MLETRKTSKLQKTLKTMPVTLSLASMLESLASKYNDASKKYFNQMACMTIYQN